MNTSLTQTLGRLRRILPFPRAAIPADVALKPHRRGLERYIRGQGLEIGALHNPMPVDRRRATVRYVDHLTLEGMRQHYPELAGYNMVAPDVVADADTLMMIDSSSEDFVIANHLLEHLQDPIGALKEWYRVLRPGGVLFLALPDKRLTFDKDRPRTSLAHLIEDHVDRGARSRAGHYEEYSRLVHKKSGADLDQDVASMTGRNYAIHFHVWVPEDVAELLAYVQRECNLQWKILEQIDSTGTDEFIFVLRKVT